MLNIQRVIMREIRLALRDPFRISSGVVYERRILLLEVANERGETVWSECVAHEAPNYSSETVDTAWWAIREWVAPRVIGRTFRHPREISPALEEGIRGHRMAKAAMEMACWALAARLKGMALADFLGGTRDWIPTGISLGIEANPAQLVAKAEQALEAGYRKIKLKIKPGADLQYIRAVREALGPGAPLMVDANSAYLPSDAEHLAQLDQFDLVMIEQPLASDDLIRHAALQGRLRTPLCLDESIVHLQSAEDMLTLGSGEIINIKPGRVGGLTSSIAIHDLCVERGIPVWCGGMLESGIGRAYNVALASLPGFTIPGDLSPSARYWEQDIVTPEWTMDGNGMVAVPRDRAGIGVAVNTQRIDQLSVRMETLEA